MKLRSRPLPLVLLLIASIKAVSAVDQIQHEAPSLAEAGLNARQDVNPDIKDSLSPHIIGTKPDVGTKDAPIDGLDGKPRNGPFVDGAPKVPAKGKIPILTDEGIIMPASVPKEQAAKVVAADGVMNDPNRNPPKKGTTGTEGGVSEKAKDRKLAEELALDKQLNKPSSSKEKEAAVPFRGQTRKSPKVEDPPGKWKVGKNAPNGLDDVRPLGAADIPNSKGQPALPRDDDDDSAIDAEVPKSSSGDESLADSKAPPTSLQSEGDSSTSKLPLTGTSEDSTDYQDSHDIIPWDSLAGSFSSIAATEIGDKTFIVAALMAMRHDRLQVFTAAYSALLIMTVLSGICGHAVGTIISKRWAAVAAAVLFLVFGAKSIQEGLAMSPDQGVGEEMKEVEAELEEKEVDIARQEDGRRRASSISPYALEAGRTDRKSRSRSRLGAPKRLSSSTSRSPSPSRGTTMATAMSGIRNLLSLLLSPAWVETFSMTFVGELGDRSQIATVAMAAGQEYFWVMVGASLGHFICTGVAVLGGSVLAGKVSMRKVTLVGGAIFIAFGIFTFLEAISYWM